MAHIGPVADDLQREVISSPDRYPRKTDAPVRYLPVTLGGLLLGYFWVSAADDAVGFVTREAGGFEAQNAAIAWATRLRQSKADGLTPVQAFQHWIGQPPETFDQELHTGAVEPDAEERQLPSLDALKDLADADGPPPFYRNHVSIYHRHWASIAGCLVGGAIGDALGYPVEFSSLDTIRRQFGPAGVTGFVPYGDRSGLISDDTQMTLFTCEGLITSAVASDDRDADPTPHVYRSYLRWLKTQGSEGSPADAASWLARQEWLYSSRAPGNACTSGLAFGGMGTRDAPKNPESKGCGTVMRAAPYGLTADTPRDAFEQAVDSAVLTHGHPTGYLAAGALAAIIRASRDGNPVWHRLTAVLIMLRNRPGGEEVSAALKAAFEAANAGPPSPEIVESLGGGWTAEEALAIAVYAAMVYPGRDQIREALLLSVNHSGDSDSTGAICGNILGAQHGLHALPADLAGAVEGRSTIDQVAADLAWVNTAHWRRRLPDRTADLTASYPASDEPVSSDLYPGRTESPVRYLPVSSGDTPLGYLWASTANDAASFACLGGTDQAEVESRKAGTVWLDRLRRSKAEGKTPLQALRFWTFEPEDPVAGAVRPGTDPAELPGLPALRGLTEPKGLDVMSPQEIADLRRHQDRVKACLLGGAVGDALGYPIEFDPLPEIRAAHGERGITGFVRGQVAGFHAGGTGYVSDDTQMTLYTCEGLITAAIAGDTGYSLEGHERTDTNWTDPAPYVYRSYQRWLKTQHEPRPPRPAPSWLAGQAWMYSARAPGNACMSGLSREGMGTRANPRNPMSKECGTVMRAAPFGLQPGKTTGEVFNEAIDASVLTHGHPTGYLAAATFAAIIRALLDGDSLWKALQRATKYLMDIRDSEELCGALGTALEAYGSQAAPSPEVVESIGQGWTAEEALAIAVYAALAYPAPEQTRDALLLAVNHSGDSDSTGAICGNILGAWHGAAALPADLVDGVEGRETVEAIASDLAMVTWPRWRRDAPTEYVERVTARYPAE